ncbi:MAG TPA: hypothetical protein VHF23_08995 [Gaiellaceae bacterium]|nr:hypothetical protein [Gaiellaceae bacterium]
MGSDAQRILVLAARQPEFAALLENAGYDVDVRSRPVTGENVDADVAVVFRGRLIGRQQAATLTGRGIPVVEVLTVEPPGASRADWVRLSNRVPKSDLVQVVHAVASWARSRVGAAASAA